MFEPYTKRARRVIFLARHEASQFGSMTIESEHLLLGLIRENTNLIHRFAPGAPSVQDISNEVTAHLTFRQKVPTAIDMPLSNECKRILAYSAEEAERLAHRLIAEEHLLLGMLREEKCPAAKVLYQLGLRLDVIRAELARHPIAEEPARSGVTSVGFSHPLSSFLRMSFLRSLLKQGRRRKVAAMRRDYELQPAPESLFERRPVVRRCVDRRPGMSEIDAHGSGAILVVGKQLPYRLTRREEFVIPLDEAPTLTITSDPYNSVAVLGSTGRDWAISLCVQGEGESEAEAHERLQQVSLSAAGGRLAITAPGLYEGSHRRGDLVVEGPIDGGVVIHCTYTPVEVRDMAGPVRVAATHARASILDTTGQVDATAGVVDFAGSCGRVTLNAEAEINLKVTARRFEGTLLASAQRCVRVLVPLGFASPIEAVVSRHANFVCRTEFASNVKGKRQGELYIFTYGINNGDRSGAALHLRSEEATVVIDGASAK